MEIILSFIAGIVVTVIAILMIGKHHSEMEDDDEEPDTCVVYEEIMDGVYFFYEFGTNQFVTQGVDKNQALADVGKFFNRSYVLIVAKDAIAV